MRRPSIAKFKRELDKTLADCEEAFSNRPQAGSQNRNALIKALDDAIQAELATSEEIFRMQNRIIEILMMEIRLGDVVTQAPYHMICEYMLKIKEYETFKNWLKEFEEQFPTADDPLRLKLQYAYHIKDQKMFKQAIAEAKKRNIYDHQRRH